MNPDKPDFNTFNHWQKETFLNGLQLLQNGNMSSEYFRLCIKNAFECGFYQAKGADYSNIELGELG